MKELEIEVEKIIVTEEIDNDGIIREVKVVEEIEDIEISEHYTIIVNADEKHVDERRLSYDHVVKLAFGTESPDKAYTVKYSHGPKENPKGNMSKGDVVEIKDGMIFNVTATDKS